MFLRDAKTTGPNYVPEVVNCLGEESAFLQLKGESSLPEEG